MASVDPTGSPKIRMTIVTSRPSSKAPRVTEAGRGVAGLTARNLGQAKSVVLAIDRSQSMHGKSLADAVSAASRFLALKRPDDQFAVVSFASRTVVDAGFASDTGAASDALRSLQTDPRYGTTLFDAIVQSAKALRGQGSPGRVIILVTDGQETTSSASLQQAIKAARAAYALVYPVAIESRSFSPKPLRELAQKTGGSYYGAASSAELTRIYTYLSRQLRRTWSLEYLTTARPGETVRTRVSVPGRGATSSTFKIPGTLATPRGSGLSLALLASLGLIAAILSILSAPLVRAVRSGRLWQRLDSDF